MLFVLGDDPFVLEWDDAVGCADASAVLARVRLVVGDELARGELCRAIAARGTVRAIPRGVELTLTVDEPALERRIEAPDCAGIVEAAALVLATSAVPQPIPPPPATVPCAACVCPPAPASCPSPASLAPPKPSPPPRPPRPAAILEAEAVLGVAMLDAISPGIVGRVGWGRGAVRFDAGVRHLFAQKLALAGTDAGARVSSTMAELRGCWSPSTGRIAFPLCAAVAVGAMDAAGTGTLAPRQVARRFTLGLGPGLGVRIGLARRLALAADSALWIPLVRPGFSIDGASSELFRAPPVGALFGLGLEIRLP